jgi:TPR repeat protein
VSGRARLRAAPLDSSCCQDYKQAFQWYEKAARQGHANAEFNLALLYSRGEGVAQDHKQALAYCLKAAQHGEPPMLARAQCRLGECFERGWGTAVDLNAARSWYAKAAAQGDEEGRAAECMTPMAEGRAQSRTARVYCRSVQPPLLSRWC